MCRSFCPVWAWGLVLGVLSTTAWSDEPAAADAGYIGARSTFQNCRIRFERDHMGRVAFLGGSITEMDGYRPMVSEFLRQRFPDAEWTFLNAGVASTCSTTGAMRLELDVLSGGPVDLLFVEFAVNDDQDARHKARECLRGMEGIVRHALRSNPQMDIVVTYFVNPEMLAALQQGHTPIPIAAHEQVCRAYHVSSIRLARNVADEIAAGRLTWEQYGGTHPAPRGNGIAARLIADMLSTAWSHALPDDAQPAAAPLPDPLDAGNYEHGRFLPRAAASLGNGWRWERPDWQSIAGSCRSRFAQLELLCADQPGAELTVRFEGRGVGAYVLAGPDAGTVVVQIDREPQQQVDLYHAFSSGLHYPRTVMFATDLNEGPHTLTLRVGSAHHERSQGHAVRIVQLVAE